MPLPRSSKEKSARLDWGYVHRESRLARVRGWLWVLAGLLAAAPLTTATLASSLFGPPVPLARSASRGPLASPHAAWENQCEVCHEPFSQIHSDRWLGALTGHANAEHWRNVRCEQCHSAPAHHPNQKPDSVAGCADCHREHQGRNASLLRLADDTCVRCHASLKDHWLMPTKDGTAEQVTTFARPDGHPEFRVTDVARGKHERTLKFSHATHMTKGMGLPSGPFAERQLECSTCHQLEASGRTYSPVTFKAHCQECHPLTFDNSPAMRSAQAPHHVQPDELERFLRMVYTDRFVHEGLIAPKGPDRGPGRLDPPPSVVTAAKGKIDAAVTAARQTLLIGRTTCLECHDAEYPAPVIAEPRIPTKIKPVKVPASWMPHARFDHASHRAMECQQCHPQAYANKATEEAAARAWSSNPSAVYSHKPDLPDAANCRQCHSPPGKVRHGCTDCHKYHGPGHGAPEQRFPTAADWLRGSRP